MAIPLCNVCLAIIIVVIINGSATKRQRSARVYASVLSLVILAVYNFSQNVSAVKSHTQTLHSNNYMQKVDALVPSNSVVASLKGSKDMQSIFLKYNAVYPLGDFLFLFNRNIHSVNIGDLSTGIDLKSSLDSSRSVKAIRDGIFYRYSLRTENQGITDQALMKQFMVDFKIKYLLVSRNAKIPDSLKESIHVVVEDSVSGERFLELDPTKM